MAAPCTVADLAAFLGITIANDNASALAAIRAAWAAIQEETQQTLELVEEDEVVLDVRAGSWRLFLPQLPVTEVSAVEEAGTALVLTDHYLWNARGVLYRVGREWTEGVQKVTVTYSHGYTEGSMPDTIWDVCRRAAARSYQAGLRAAEASGVAGVQGQTIGDYQVQFASDSAGNAESSLGASAAPILLRSEKAALARYRLKSLG